MMASVVRRSVLPFVVLAYVLGLAYMLTPAATTAATCVLQGPLKGPLQDKHADFLKDFGKVPSIERDDRPMDVLLYDIDLTTSIDMPSVQGNVAIEFTPIGSAMTEAVFDLLDNMVVSDAWVDGSTASFTHANDEVAVDLGGSLNPGETATVTIFYSGEPQPVSLQGFRVSQFFDEDFFPDPDRPVVSTLSEPDGARSWWPCHDSPYDAAATELSITAPDFMILAAPGVKTEEFDLGGGMWRQTYSMPTPIPAYLVSFTLSKFDARWTESATVQVFDPAVTNGNYATVSMPVEYFVDDLREPGARHSWQNTVEMLGVFEGLWGPYPYSDLDPGPGILVGKYGMALFVSAFAMEHPTMSSMGTWTASSGTDDETGAPSLEWVVAHEMFHQWFGDAVRVERWGEIWLNEGFASYGEAIWDEEKYGAAAGKARIMSKRQTNYTGTILDPDPSDVFGFTVYRKGAWVLHMLRQVMGRDALMRALREYVTDPELRHGRAVNTSDFQAKCEAVVRDENMPLVLLNDSLDWFFVPWLQRQGRPDLDVTWTQLEGAVRVQVEQPANRVYRLPLPVRLLLGNGSIRNELMWIDGTSTAQEFAVAADAVDVVIDGDEDWLLNTTISEFTPVSSVQLRAPYPNPAGEGDDATVFIPVVTTGTQMVRLEVYDLRGRRVRQITEEEFAQGEELVIWDLRNDDGDALASGIYHVRLISGDVEDVRPIVLIK